MYYKWDKSRAENHIDNLCEEVREVTIKQYTRDKSLSNIKVNEAYAMDAVHLYVDILNLEGILTTQNGTESDTTHQRAIRFFDSHVRAIKFILAVSIGYSFTISSIKFAINCTDSLASSLSENLFSSASK